MTLSLAAPKTEFTVAEFSEMLTTQFALDREGIKLADQPVAVTIGTASMRETTIYSFLELPEDESKSFDTSEVLLYTGEDSQVCISALTSLARSRSGYHQRNAVRMLEEKGMARTAKVCQLIATAKCLVPKRFSASPAPPIVPDTPIIYNHEIDILTPLTAWECKEIEYRIMEEAATFGPKTPLHPDTPTNFG